MNLLHKPKLLIIESDHEKLRKIKAVIDHVEIDFSVLEATSNQEVWDKLKTSNIKERPKIIILDFNNEVIDGLEIAKEIRNTASLKSIMIYVITAEESEQKLVEALNLNVAGYIIEPTDLRKVFTTLKNYWSIIEF
jgi:DNA-binding response OmpR family regulator